MVNGYPNVFMIIRTDNYYHTALLHSGLYRVFFRKLFFQTFMFIGKILQMSCGFCEEYLTENYYNGTREFREKMNEIRSLE